MQDTNTNIIICIIPIIKNCSGVKNPTNSLIDPRIIKETPTNNNIK